MSPQLKTSYLGVKILVGMSKEKGFHEGEWEFTFPNGDVYKGQYCAHVSGLAWRQGRGTYITHDGQQYQGNWKDDKLNEAENLEITYQNQDKYTGRIHKYKYNGPGTYSFKRGHLTCEFVNNKPSGEVIYIDHHGQMWYGYGDKEHVLLNKEHIFWYELDSERGKVRPKYVPKTVTQPVEDEEEESVDMKDLERQVFAKSTKTPADIDFEDSEWYREYQNFVETYKSVFAKISSRGTSSLTSEEKIWYKQYLESAKIAKGRRKKPHQDLLRRYFTEQREHTCPPIPVFYPTRYEEG